MGGVKTSLLDFLRHQTKSFTSTMKFAAVICEFNPFHNGHAHLLQEARKLSGCDALLCVMSGDFVQRARPAAADMRLRAHAALLNGADAAIELPALYATACGEQFAAGAINIIGSIPGVAHLCFGSESGRLKYLQKAAEIQCKESGLFKQTLRRLLDEGRPYAAAYAQATEKELGEAAPRLPNDVLGVEYLKRLLKTGSAIQPVAIQRVGAGYRGAEHKGAYSSASALRDFFKSGDFDAAKNAMPESAYRLFQADFDKYRQADEYFDVLAAEALRSRDLSLCPDGGEGLELKLKKNARKFAALDKIVAATKSKRYTEARIRRLCLQALLGITHYPGQGAGDDETKNEKRKTKNDRLNQITNEDESCAVGRESSPVAAAESPSLPIHYSLFTIHSPAPHSSLLTPNSPPSAIRHPPSTVFTIHSPSAAPPLPAKLLGVNAALKNAILRVLPKNIIVRNKDFEAYVSALSPVGQEAARYIWRVNRIAAGIYPLLRARDGEFYASEPLLVTE